MPTLDQRILSDPRYKPALTRTRKLIADRFVSPCEWDALVREQYRLSLELQAQPSVDNETAYCAGDNDGLY